MPMRLVLSTRLAGLLALLAAALVAAGCATFGNAYEGADEDETRRWKHMGFPLDPGQVFEVRQGAFGKSSHSEPGNEYSWDFAVPWGTPVVAAEGGTVLAVHAPPGGAGCDPKLADVAHNAQVEHADGTVAQYVHVASRVRVGQVVGRGDVIGVTAPSGWVCYPHVHFGVYQSRRHLYASPARRTVPIWFEAVPGGVLKEGFKVSDQFR
jgi:murein DD-endopeptidase MepM/ murein hydrolase activator NlpD